MNKTRNKGLFELNVIFGSCASSQIAFYHILCMCVYLDLVAIKCRNTLKTMLKNIKSICRSLNIRINYLSLTIILDITKD